MVCIVGSVFLDVGRSFLPMTTHILRVYIYFRLLTKVADPYVLMREPSRIFGSGICEFNHRFLMSDAGINSYMYPELGSLIFFVKSVSFGWSITFF